MKKNNVLLAGCLCWAIASIVPFSSVGQDTEVPGDVGGSGGIVNPQPDLIPVQPAMEFIQRPYFAPIPIPFGSNKISEPIVFEAEPSLYLPFFNNVRRNAKQGDHLAINVAFAFDPMLRMFNDSSAPVKMPSYKPGLLAQGYYFGTVSKTGLCNALLGSNSPNIWMGNLSASFFHYSNGQFGSTYSTQYTDGSPGSDSADLAAEKVDPSPLLNRKGGDFSTNYFTVGVGAKWYWINSYSTQVGSFSCFGQYTRNIDLRPLIHNFSPYERYIYGENRFSLRIEGDLAWPRGSYFCGENRASLFVELCPSQNESVPHYLYEIEVSHSFDSWEGVGIFLRLHQGQDRYNARFVDNLTQFLWGFTWEPSDRLRFGKFR